MVAESNKLDNFPVTFDRDVIIVKGDREQTAKNYLEWVNTKELVNLQANDLKVGLHLTDDWEEECIQQFLIYDELLTEPSVFWWVASHLYTYCGIREGTYDAWMDAFERHEEHFNNKIWWCNDSLEGGIEIIDEFDEHVMPKFDIESVSAYFQQRSQKMPITVYRGFKVRAGEAVRKGVKKLDNVDAHLQVEGSGASYSLSKDVAMEHNNVWLHNYFLANHGDLVDKESQDEYIEYLYGEVWKQNIIERYKRDKDEAWWCVGTYKISKKDIIFVKMGSYQEVVCKPTDVELVRYDFMGWKDSIGALFVNNFVRHHREWGGNLLRFYNFDEKTAIRICTKLAAVLEKDQDFLASFYSADDVSQLYFSEMMRYLHNVLLEYMRIEGRKAKLYESTTMEQHIEALKLFWEKRNKLIKIESPESEEVKVRDERKVLEVIVEVGRQLWASK